MSGLICACEYHCRADESVIVGRQEIGWRVKNQLVSDCWREQDVCGRGTISMNMASTADNTHT